MPCVEAGATDAGAFKVVLPADAAAGYIIGVMFDIATGEVFERENLAWLHRAADESAEPSVSRGIHLEHGRLPSARLEGLVVDHDPVALVRERLRVAAYPEHVVVSRQRPEARAARLWVPMDGILGAQTAKKLVRGSPSEEADIAQVDLSSGLRHLVPRHRRSIGS